MKNPANKKGWRFLLLCISICGVVAGSNACGEGDNDLLLFKSGEFHRYGNTELDLYHEVKIWGSELHGWSKNVLHVAHRFARTEGEQRENVNHLVKDISIRRCELGDKNRKDKINIYSINGQETSHPDETAAVEQLEVSFSSIRKQLDDQFPLKESYGKPIQYKPGDIPPLWPFALRALYEQIIAREKDKKTLFTKDGKPWPCGKNENDKYLCNLGDLMARTIGERVIIVRATHKGAAKLVDAVLQTIPKMGDKRGQQESRVVSVLEIPSKFHKLITNYGKSDGKNGKDSEVWYFNTVGEVTTRTVKDVVHVDFDKLLEEEDKGAKDDSIYRQTAFLLVPQSQFNQAQELLKKT